VIPAAYDVWLKVVDRRLLAVNYLNIDHTPIRQQRTQLHEVQTRHLLGTQHKIRVSVMLKQLTVHKQGWCSCEISR